MTLTIQSFPDGIVVLGDSTDETVIEEIKKITEKVGLIIADPPYGNIVDEVWDKTKQTDKEFALWMVDWTMHYANSLLLDGGAFYVWGGIGIPGFRPFLHYCHDVEIKKEFELANLITWKKRRAYGTANNYLFTREECAYFVKGSSKKPRKFHIPLLNEKRGYSGFNTKYPAKSEFYRRSNVWTDVNELMRGKVHPTEKAQRLHEIMIEIHTDVGEWVVDPFAGSGVTALAARKLGRKFAIVENDKTYFDNIVERLSM